MRLSIGIALLLAAPAAFAWHDHASACPLDGVVEVTDGTAAHTVYVDRGDDARSPEAHLYVETNGLWHASPAGVYAADDTDGDLQRGGGASPFIPDDVETCVDDPLVMPDGYVIV